MGAIITVIGGQQKTGVTTAAINLAHGLALTGLNTLLVDFNPNGRASALLDEFRESSRPSSADLFIAHGDLAKISSRAIQDQVRPNLDLMPASVDLAAAISQFEAEPLVDKDLLLVNALSQLRLHYQTVVIDTPPAMDSLKRNVLSSSSLVISPVETIAAARSVGDLLSSISPAELWGAWLMALPDTTEAKLSALRQVLFLEIERTIFRLSSAAADEEELPRFNLDVLKSRLPRIDSAMLRKLHQATVFDLPAARPDALKELGAAAGRFMNFVEEISALTVSEAAQPASYVGQKSGRQSQYG